MAALHNCVHTLMSKQTEFPSSRVGLIRVASRLMSYNFSSPERSLCRWTAPNFPSKYLISAVNPGGKWAHTNSHTNSRRGPLIALYFCIRTNQNQWSYFLSRFRSDFRNLYLMVLFGPGVHRESSCPPGDCAPHPQTIAERCAGPRSMRRDNGTEPNPKEVCARTTVKPPAQLFASAWHGGDFVARSAPILQPKQRAYQQVFIG
jgi:hypothetical protein